MSSALISENGYAIINKLYKCNKTILGDFYQHELINIQLKDTIDENNEINLKANALGYELLLQKQKGHRR